MYNNLILLGVFLLCLIPTNYLLKFLTIWGVPSPIRTMVAVLFLFIATTLAAAYIF